MHLTLERTVVAASPLFAMPLAMADWRQLNIAETIQRGHPNRAAETQESTCRRHRCTSVRRARNPHADRDTADGCPALR